MSKNKVICDGEDDGFLLVSTSGSTMPGQFLPITDVTLVTQKDTVLNSGYTTLEQTSENHDANVWESSWRSKGKRFLSFACDPNESYIVTDICIIPDDKEVPDGFHGCFQTRDSKEKGLRKHVLCVKKEMKTSVSTAVCSILVLSVSKGEFPPSGYTYIGPPLNDLHVVIKCDEITPPAPVPAPRKTSSNPVQSTLQRQQSMFCPSSLLQGVPFIINPKFDTKTMANDPLVSSIAIMSIEDISARYTYSFETEETIVSG